MLTGTLINTQMCVINQINGGCQFVFSISSLCSRSSSRLPKGLRITRVSWEFRRNIRKTYLPKRANGFIADVLPIATKALGQCTDTCSVWSCWSHFCTINQTEEVRCVTEALNKWFIYASSTFMEPSSKCSMFINICRTVINVSCLKRGTMVLNSTKKFYLNFVLSVQW